MSDTTPVDMEKRSAAAAAAAADHGVDIDRPRGWKYRNIKIGPWTLPWYASPPIQLVIVSFVCFLCPGMFNALSGMGGGGQFDARYVQINIMCLHVYDVADLLKSRAADDANTALYSTFAVIGFFAGTFTNKIGIRFALSFGGIGYSVYVASFLSYSHNQNHGFTTFAGALLGVCAGLLWTAQG
jgi:Ion channel regulatory protein UNC-93